MIAKKTRSKKTKSKAAHVSDLIDYVCDAVDDAPRPRPERAQRPAPSQVTRRPKVLHVGAFGFVTRRRSGWKAEMVALAFEAPRSKNPFSHWILSWPKGEVPTARQFDEAVVLFLDELGLPEHQVVYAAHQDTENVHLHMVINRVHPDTVRVIKPNRGFDHEAGQRAIARIEHVQGWKPERGARYAVSPDGSIARIPKAGPAARKPSQRARDIEVWSGERSAERICIEEAAPRMAAASTWADLHRELAAIGIEYRRKGSGGVLVVGEIVVKASSAGRGCSLPLLSKRLGAFEPSSPTAEVRTRMPEPVAPTATRRAYVAARHAHLDRKRDDEQALKRRHAAERAALAEAQRLERSSRYSSESWKGRGRERNEIAHLVATEHAAVRQALLDRHAADRAALRDRYPPWPRYSDWASALRGPVIKSARPAEDVRPDAAEPERRDPAERSPALTIATHQPGRPPPAASATDITSLPAHELTVILGPHDPLPPVRPVPKAAGIGSLNSVALIARLWRVRWVEPVESPSHSSWETIRRLSPLLRASIGQPAPGLSAVLAALPPTDVGAMRAEITMRMADLHALEFAFVQARLIALDAAIPGGDSRRGSWLSLRWLDQEGISADNPLLADRLLARSGLLASLVDELQRRDAEIEEAIERSGDSLQGPGQ